MRELPIRRVSFWLRFLNSVTFRPTGFLLLSASFFFLSLLFISTLFVRLFPPLQVTGLQVPTGWSSHCSQVLTKTQQKWSNNAEHRVNQTGMSACQSLICVRCPCARARVLSRFLGTSGSSWTSPWLHVSLVPRRQNNEGASLQSPMSSNPFCSTTLRWNLMAGWNGWIWR